ncbi:hypothetical protein F4782DRAFT_534559 [Xylaria castorea]|nr:hypothetical protein F4782DRAFT_534559 [Xylaria castorea]
MNTTNEEFEALVAKIRHQIHPETAQQSTNSYEDQEVYAPIDPAEEAKAEDHISENEDSELDSPNKRSKQAILTPSTEEWMPFARQQPSLTSALMLRYISSCKHDHWFLTLVDATETRDESSATQARMLAKLYLFVHDYIPYCLTGAYAHIRGEDIMHNILCKSKERSLARHVISKEADAAFAKLADWMERGDTWKESLANAEAKATGLLSPSNILALLILLIIDSREALDVRHSFREGPTSQNLGEVFEHKKDVRQAEVPLLVDYNRLFGSDFVRCIVDIRRYIPSLLQDISLKGSPADRATPADSATPEVDIPDSPAPEEAKGQFVGELREETGKLDATIIRGLAAAAEAQVSILLNAIKAAAAVQVSAIREELEVIGTDIQAVRELVPAIQEATPAWNAIIRVEGGIEAFRNRIEAKLADLQVVTSKFREPKLGKDSYLISCCPVLSDIAQDLKAYEARLIRAAWFYFGCFGSPDNDVGADSDATNAPMDKFPDLPGQHVLEAIRHVHVRAFSKQL